MNNDQNTVNCERSFGKLTFPFLLSFFGFQTSLLSTGKKKAKASRVFGGEVFNETETSLWYSPSPRKARSCSNEELVADPVPVTLFAQDDLEKNKPASIEDYRKENIPNNDHLDSNDLHKNISFQSIRNAEMNRLRAAKSPLRRSLAEKTEAAIQNATASVKQTLKSSSSINQSLNACQDAKKAAVRQRTKHTKSVRFQWDEQNATSKTFYNKVEENRRQLLAVQRKLASAHFQQKARKQETERLQRIAALDRELEFNSEVFRDHQKKLQDERDQKRKISMDTRAKLRVNKRAGEEKLEIMRREEEAAILEVRSDLHRARIEGGKASAEERRKSFNFRAGDAKRIRDIRSTWKHDENVQLHNSFELSRAAAKDVEAYKKQISLERRQSLQNRNCDARRRRNKERDNTYAAMRAEHESYELKWVGEKDAEEYQKRMREERRKSLASRNKESFRHAKVMQELRALTFEKETESFLLKVAAENDAKAYLQKLADERRESLKIRGKEARRQRMYEEEQVRQAVVDALKEEILQSECEFISHTLSMVYVIAYIY